MQQHYGTIVIGAGAAGMMCAANLDGPTLVVEHRKSPGEKIRISGGGRCNFTNIHTRADNFLSQNPHFAKSALSRYTPEDFISLIERHNIAYHEKTLGQLFCNNSAQDIIQMLQVEMAKKNAQLVLEAEISNIRKTESHFEVSITHSNQIQKITADHLVIACGGKSIPKIGATGFGYQVAEQFGHDIVETRPALVPLTFTNELLEAFSALAGIGLEASVSCGKTHFDEAILFTHRGLSGPAILQISSFWREKQAIQIALLPGHDCLEYFREERRNSGKRLIQNVLSDRLPKKLAASLAQELAISGNLGDCSDNVLKRLCDRLNHWTVYPTGTEGYRTAEVTLGGVSTAGLHSQSMQSKNVKDLYFIGEVVDVTGWLGGYNFQWAWASAVVAARAINQR